MGRGGTLRGGGITTTRDRDLWEGYDHWHMGRVRVAGRVNGLLSRRPVLLPGALLVLGLVAVAVGLLLPDVPPESSTAWVRPVLLGGGGLLATLGVGGLFSALLVRVFGAEAPKRGGKRPWV